jgi:hypothetical protein
MLHGKPPRLQNLRSGWNAASGRPATAGNEARVERVRVIGSPDANDRNG